MSETKSLLLGCGHDRKKRVALSAKPGWSGRLVTLDMNPRSEPDVLWDLEKLPLPFPDDEFDEIGAYDVLEHVGRQGDWRRWFDECSEYHRILKPGGEFTISVPTGHIALCDPGHTRFFHKFWFLFLNQQWYNDQYSEGRSATDYRFYWKKNFDILAIDESDPTFLAVILRKA